VNFALAAALAAEASAQAAAPAETAAETKVSEPAADTPPAEKKFIEIWRPRRHSHHGHHGRRGERGERHKQAVNGEGAPDAKTGGKRERGRDRNKAPNPANTGYRAREADAAPAVGAAAATPDAHSAAVVEDGASTPNATPRPNKPGFERRQGFERPGFERPGFERKGRDNSGGDAARRDSERRREGGGGFQARGDRKGGRDREDRSGVTLRAAPPPSQRSAGAADSPFAALSQLKAALEKGKKD
jgi:hypothetical protein